jgi:hypothetical protein
MREDGVFDLQKAIGQIEMTRHKHRQNVVNYQKNKLTEVRSPKSIIKNLLLSSYVEDDSQLY